MLLPGANESIDCLPNPNPPPQEVRHHLKALDVPALLELLATVRQDLVSDQKKGKAKKATAASHQRGAALGAAVRQCCGAVEACTAAAELLVQEVAQGHFLNLLVLFLAVLGRLSALLRRVGTLVYGLYQVLLPGGAKKLGLEARTVARILELESTGTTTARNEESQRGKEKTNNVDNHDDDDLGVSLGTNAAAAAATFSFMAVAPAAPAAPTVKAKVIPTTTTSSSSAASRAMLASEYSSSSEEEEEKQAAKGLVGVVPTTQASKDEVEEEEEEEKMSNAAIRFVIDRKPATNPPGSDTAQVKTPKPQNKKKRSAAPPVTREEGPAAPTLAPPASKKKKLKASKGNGSAAGGSLLDAIDDIFQAAGAKHKKKGVKKR